jgi:prepilin-type N-terminal cleavage/methylation domain-containing protein
MHKPRKHSSWPHQGFTLVELALVLALIGLVFGGLAVPLATQITQKNVLETQNKLQTTIDTLIGYATLNGHLPCPDTNGDGLSEPTCNDSVSGSNVSLGYVPWVTLGLSFQSDAWGNRMRYAASSDLICGFSTLSSGPAAGCGASSSTSIERLDIDCTAIGNNAQLPSCSTAAANSANVADHVALLVFS